MRRHTFEILCCVETPETFTILICQSLLCPWMALPWSWFDITYSFLYVQSTELVPFQAQTHARKASKANTPATAIKEHDLAAGQFASAANGTRNSEVSLTSQILVVVVR